MYMKKTSSVAKKSNGIQRSLRHYVELVFGITAVMILLLTYFTAITNTINSKRNIFVAETSKSASDMTAWFDKQCFMMDNIAQAVDSGKYDSDNFDKAYDFLVDMQSVSDEVYVFYIGKSDKSSVFSDGWDAAAENYDPTDRDWYTKAVEAKKAVVSDPYIDVKTKELVITVSKPIFHDNGNVSVVAADIFVTSVIDIAKSDISGSYYPILVDAAGDIVVHRNDAYLPYVDDEENEHYTKASDTNFAAIAGSENGKIYTGTDENGSASIYAKESVGDYGWTIMYAQDTYSFYFDEIWLVAVFFFVLVALIAINTVILNIQINHKLKPLSEINKAADSMKNGQLSYKSGYRKNDEIGTACLAIEEANGMLKNYVSDIDRKLGLMADGNFNNEITLQYIGDFADIRDSMVKIQNSLKDTLLQIETAAGQVSEGSAQLAAGAQELSDGAAMQASAIDTLSTNCELVSDKVKTTADNANRANEIVTEMGEKVNLCNDSMNKLSEAMQEIGDKSGEIKKIIQTVEDIAFQTNILALNAAVEAARAGEAGKGFAVVADEVRNLAGKTADAAALTSQLIEHTVVAVANGTELTTDTAGAMVTLVDSANEAVSIVSSITSDANAESDELAKITDGVEQIANVIQRNTATAEESAASSEELSGQATILKSLTDRFEL
ncbi:MAG: hypothetical protein J6L61_04945 [Ruminiclostridium sp.]|nr:hypothetical protein [Ruminiclostridium sp.]